ncbi:class I SAM-dependent methyltransferase [Telmatospirillum siberiense]|nr:class I SAM-dependent methyltransferase [Telmatospirillum siberiense]
MSEPAPLFIDSARYFGAGRPERLEDRLSITVTARAFPPYLDDLKEDWVASVAIPAFRTLERRRPGTVGAFCSIGTGTGLDALGAIEVFGARRVGITDVHDEVVSTAAANIRGNLRDPASVRLLAGTGDLLSPLASEGPRFDVIYENLPNVPLDDGSQLEKDRVSSSFFPARREVVPEDLKANLLTLHYVALVQAKDFLAPAGIVLSMLGGRVPLEVFLDMSRLAGYRPRFLSYGWKIQAEAEDVLSGYAAWQRHGLGPFHFYHEPDVAAAFAGLDPVDAAANALAIERDLAPRSLDAEAAYAAFKGGERIAHTYAVLESALE